MFQLDCTDEEASELDRAIVIESNGKHESTLT